MARPKMNNTEKLIRRAYEKGYRAKEDGTIYNPKGKKIGFKVDNRNVFSYYYEDYFSQVRCSRFIAYQLWGDKIFEKGVVVRHLNDIKDDDRFDNLALGTQADNMADKKKNGTKKKKYTYEEKKKIYLYYLKYGFANTSRKFHFSGNYVLTYTIRQFNDYNLSLADKARMIFIRK
jgi:hypothetical protein